MDHLTLSNFNDAPIGQLHQLRSWIAELKQLPVRPFHDVLALACRRRSTARPLRWRHEDRLR